MTGSCNLSGWAQDLLFMLQDTTTPTGVVVTWLQSNLHTLNTYIYGDFFVSGDCIYPQLTPTQSGIYSEMYICNSFRMSAYRSVGAAGCDWIEIAGEGQGRIRRANKTDVARAAQAAADACYQRLDKLLCWYRVNSGFGLPQQVLLNYGVGVGNVPCYSPPIELYSCYNPIWC